jgi:hypothetical protein
MHAIWDWEAPGNKMLAREAIPFQVSHVKQFSPFLKDESSFLLV